jgi:hypothetical protein
MKNDLRILAEVKKPEEGMVVGDYIYRKGRWEQQMNDTIRMREKKDKNIKHTFNIFIYLHIIEMTIIGILILCLILK